MMSCLGFVLDLDRCTGCGACVLGCQIANGLSPHESWRRVESFNRERYPGLPVVHLSLGCFHCDDPACANGCPARALRRDPQTGTVQLDVNRCLGCRYCTWLCPFGAPRFDRRQGTVAKCTLCIDRVRDGLDPGCVTACPTGALTVVDHDADAADESAQWAPGMPGRELGPALTVRRLRRRGPPRIGPSPPPVAPAPQPPVRSWTNVAREWSLLVFSLVVVASAGWFLGDLAGGPAVVLPGWLALGLVASLVAAAHLGRPERAWRAAGNLRRSWVSREVVLFGLFLVGGVGVSVLSPNRWAAALVAAFGLATVLAVDMVYRIRRQEHPVVPHSAMATLTTLLVASILSELIWLAVGLGVVKTGLYLWRARRFRDVGVRAVVRLGALAAGLVLLWSGHPAPGWFVLAVGEVIDRAELYAELRFLDPTLQVQRDLLQSGRGHPSSSVKV